MKVFLKSKDGAWMWIKTHPELNNPNPRLAGLPINAILEASIVVAEDGSVLKNRYPDVPFEIPAEVEEASVVMGNRIVPITEGKSYQVGIRAGDNWLPPKEILEKSYYLQD